MAVAGAPAHAFDWREQLTDPTDHRLDASQWLLERRGFLPVPIMITEPAVGYGGGLAVAFFHRDAEDRPRAPAAEFIPPSITGVAAAATENGTKVGALGHLGIWRNNTLRYTGGAAALSVNLNFYGSSDLPLLHEGVEYNLEGWGTFHQLMWRWPQTRFWLGAQLLYFDADLAGREELQRFNGNVVNTGAGAIGTFDTRDNMFTPTRGLQLEWHARQHWGEFVRDFEYLDIGARNRFYFAPVPRWVVGWRLDMSFVSGDVPFYTLPSINQRGIAKGRYQGAAVVVTELETRYDFDGRWFGVAFAGVGRAGNKLDELDAESSRWAGGAGFRYLIARALGMQAGIDVARGPDEWTFYIQMGSGWVF